MGVLGPPPRAGGILRPVRADGWPVFRRDCGKYATFYAPGCLCVVELAEAERFAAAIGPPASGAKVGSSILDWAAELWHRATYAREEAVALGDRPFRPECLTLYLNNECNLRCAYCYADPKMERAARLDMETVAAAAEEVARNCREKGLPFRMVFHGGGEPMLHRPQIEPILGLTDQIASRHGVEPFRYVATNGVMPEEKARWMAHSFDLVGLSCDGPADIHDRQRPGSRGEGTLRFVERTAHVLHQEGTPFQVRATITGASLHRQAEIAGYLCQQFRPEEIRFEPVYRGGRAGVDAQLDNHQAGAFVTHFWEAREVARAYGIPLSISGSRPGSVHGPHCNVFRQVLNVLPGGVATACFKVADASRAKDRGVAIGALNRQTGQFEVDAGWVQALRHKLGESPPVCADCFNRYHCAGQCPDYCPIDSGTPLMTGELGFRCQVQKSLTALLLDRIAERLWSQVARGEVKGPHGSTVL